ncbi:alpha-glycosidase [Weissella diestrammenae]|uniref:Alpha-glycosidase n=1 Tax=Weissella diestrammenae TaxID=1162633 RepID=A0A7G9T470_9LACO|nr:glycoside hydrolase family 13 protein [Weissella diestrammenae]QNN74895.1 alpha-glycosidase [Weissella diestrammenae]
MNLSAIYHRPESEMAYLYDATTMHIRLRTAKDDIASVQLIAGDPYTLWGNLEFDKFYHAPQAMTKILSTSLYDYWQISISADKRRLAYAFIIQSTDGEQVLLNDKGFGQANPETLDDMNTYFRMPYFQEIDRFKAPEWVKQTVWYQIFPERFANGNPQNDPAGTKPWDSTDHPGRFDFYGGDLQGVLDHLDHLVALGVNGIYFNPIFKAPSNHKYDTEDYYTIDPEFGDDQLFKKLVQAAHERGIRVMLDAVFNHVGDQASQWRDVLENQADSKYADWFHIHEFPATYTPTNDFEFAGDATYDTFAYTPHMPKLNTANSEVQAYLIDIATYWIKKFDIDAWRLDVANEIDHHFWKAFHAATTTLKPDFYILGEIWHNAQAWLNGDELTGIMNYAYTGSILDYFVHNRIDVQTFINQLNDQLMHYRASTNQMMFNALDSHDTPRLKTLVHENMALEKQVLTFTFLQPGVPSIYYGTEYGMTGENDPDDRKPMVWDSKYQDFEFYQFIQKLIAVRRTFSDVLSAGTLQWTHQTDDVIGIRRIGEQEQLLGLFNHGQKNFDLTNYQQQPVIISQLADNNVLRPDEFVVYQF